VHDCQASDVPREQESGICVFAALRAVLTPRGRPVGRDNFWQADKKCRGRGDEKGGARGLPLARP